jgi:BlaI family penicillinase repressor
MGGDRAGRGPQDVTDAEFEVLRVLWESPASSIRRIAEALHPRRATSHYPTVQKQLERLEAKGFVRRDRSMMVHLFSATIGRDELAGRRLDALVEKVCGGSLAPVLNHLLRTPRLTDAERQALRAMIEPPDAQSGPQPDRQPKGRARHDRKG